jgi:hypothetical protein
MCCSQTGLERLNKTRMQIEADTMINVKQVCCGTWARAIIGRFSHLSLSTVKEHRASANMFSNRQVELKKPRTPRGDVEHAAYPPIRPLAPSDLARSHVLQVPPSFIHCQYTAVRT